MIMCLEKTDTSLRVYVVADALIIRLILQTLGKDASGELATSSEIVSNVHFLHGRFRISWTLMG